MPKYYTRSRTIERAQAADRNTPMLAPETEYCLPGSRFALLMRLARAGASDRLIRKRIKGIDSLTIRVARKLVREAGSEKERRIIPLHELRGAVYALLDEGRSPEEIREITKASASAIYTYRKAWLREGRGDEAGCA